MKKINMQKIFQCLIAVTLLLPLVMIEGDVTAQAISGPETPDVITPENVLDLELLYWFGQGAFSGRIAQSSDGSLLAAITASGVALFDTRSGKETGFIPVGLEPCALSISPDDSTLAIVVNYPTGELGGFMGLPEYDREIQLYALSGGTEQTGVIRDLGECENSNIWDIAFSPDGTRLIFEKKYGSNNDNKKFCSVPLDTDQDMRTLVMNPDVNMVISPQGDYVAAAERKSDKVSVYTTADFSLFRELSIPASDWPELFFAQSGRALAVRTLTADDQEDYSMIIWDIASGEVIYSGKIPLTYNQELDQNDTVITFEVTKDKATIYLGTQFGYVYAMETKTGKLIKQLGPFTWTIYNLVANPGGATSNETSAMVRTILLSPDETQLVASEYLTTMGQSGSIHVFQMPSGNEITSLYGSPTGSENPGFALSPDSSRIALADSREGKVEVYDIHTNTLELTLNGHSQTVNQVLFSPNGKLIATCSDDKTIHLWDAQTGSSIGTLAGHQNRVNRIAFSPDSSWLISGADDNTIRRWRTTDGDLIETLELGDENWRVEFLDILDDNQSVVYRITKYPSPYIGYVQKQVLWSTQSGESTEIGGSDSFITQLVKGEKVFAGYSINSSKSVVGNLQEDGSMVILAAFQSPYGTGALTTPTVAPNLNLAVSGNGFGLHSWDISNGEAEFLGLAAGNQPVPSYGNEYLFSPDGKYLAFSSGGIVYLMGVQGK